MAGAAMTRAQMREFVMARWRAQPLLRLLHRIHLAVRTRALAGEALQREVIAVLQHFEARTRICLQVVYHFAGDPDGLPSLGETGLKAHELLEMMVRESPQRVLEFLGTS